MYPRFHFAAFQSIIDNMTLSESEITEYGDPLWSLRTPADGSDLTHRIGYFVNYERLPNTSACAIDHARSVFSDASMPADWSLLYYSIVSDGVLNPMEMEDVKPSNGCCCS